MVAIKPLSLSLAAPASQAQQRSTTPLASPAATFVHANQPPPSANDRRSTSFGGLGAALKKSTSFKSRPPSDSTLPPRSTAQQGQPRSKSMLPLSRGSTRPSTPSTNGGASTPSTNNHASSLSGLEESYVTKVGMRMLDAVNKTFAANEAGSYAGRPVPSWRKAKELGSLIEHELKAAEHDPYFFRTMLRSAVLKTLSLFLSRLSPAMAPAPAFAFPLPTPLPAGLQYTLTVARCALEVRDSLHACQGLCGEHTLQGWEEKLDDVVNRLVAPVIASIKADVSSLSVLAHEAAPATPPHSTKSLISRSTTTTAPVAPWLKQLTSIFEGTNRILAEAGEDGFKWRVQIATIAVWKFSLNFAARDVSNGLALQPATTTATKSFAAKAKTKVVPGKKSPSPPGSPPLEPSVVAPPSPPNSLSGTRNEANAKLVNEIVAFEQTIRAFVAPLGVALPVPSREQILNPQCECALCLTGRCFATDDTINNDDDDLAKAAMLEALGALSALVVVVTASTDLAAFERALDASEARMTPADVIAQSPIVKPCPTLSAALVALPDLLLAHIVIARMHAQTPAHAESGEAAAFRPPHVLSGLKWSAYAAELKGFRTAEEWTPEIFDDIRDELDRVARARGTANETKEETLLRKVLDTAA